MEDIKIGMTGLKTEVKDVKTGMTCEGLPGVYSTIWCLCYKTNELKKKKHKRGALGLTT